MRKLSFVVAITGCCMLLLAGCNIIESLKNAEHKPNPEAEKWLQTGIDYFNQGDLAKAEESFDLAIKKNPRYADAYRWQGIVMYASSHDYNKGMADFYYSAAIRLNPRDERSYYLRGIFYFDFKRQYLKALDDFNTAIELSPDYSEAYLYRGATSYELGRFEDSIKDFSRVLALDPDNSPAYFRRAHAYLSMKNYDLAMADLTKALEIDPLNSFALLDRSFIHLLRGDHEGALADANATTSPKQGNEGFYYERGYIYAQLGKRVEAEDDFRKACDEGMKEACDMLDE
jgi:tetratricopeptide (TPR) repeat protein